MSRFEQEWALVPPMAKGIAVAASLMVLLMMALPLVVLPITGPGGRPPLWGLFLAMSFVPAFLVGAFVLLIGYVWADAGRRGMNQLGWTLLAIFIPSAIGIILYFLLRDPLPVACPQCQATVGKDLACCAACGTTVRPACPQCHRPSQAGWNHCGYCGAALRPPGPAAEG